MRRFWDERAREDAYFFVDDRLDYRRPDTERFWQGGAEDLDHLLDATGMRIQSFDVVADIGCGLGRLTRPLADRAARVYALDISEEMLKRAQELNAHLGNVTWMQGSGTDLRSVPDDCLDACVSHVVFQHIPDPEITLAYVRDMGRALKPGGWSTFQVSNDPDVHRVRDPRGARPLLARLAGRAPRGLRSPAWLGSMTDLDKLGEVAGEAGLDVEQVVNPGTQMCIILLRRREDVRSPPGG